MEEEERPGDSEIEDESHENICRHCGVCCGAEDDPCEHLERLADGKYFCRIYRERFGWRRTVGGNQFRCIPIRQALFYPRIQGRCAYAATLAAPGSALPE